MPVRLRLSMHGHRHSKLFHLVAINQRQRRDAKPTELLGIYNPHMALDQTSKTIEWSVDRIRYWLHVGAIPSKRVVKLLELGKILTPDSPYHCKARGIRQPHMTDGKVLSEETVQSDEPVSSDGNLSGLRERLEKTE